MHFKQSVLSMLLLSTTAISACNKGQLGSTGNNPDTTTKDAASALVDTSIPVSLGANAWITAGTAGTIASYGLANWNNSATVFSAYVRVG